MTALASLVSSGGLQKGQLEGTRVVAVGGSKGGSGKSLVAASLAIELAELGYKVAVLDLDFGASNLHSHFGIKSPQNLVSELLFGTETDLAQYGTEAKGVTVIHGGSEFWSQTQRKHFDKGAVIARLKQSRYDYVLLDLGAGTRVEGLDFFLAADTGILVSTPEPSSVEKSMVFMQALAYRRLQLFARSTNNSEIISWMDSLLLEKRFTRRPLPWMARYSGQGYSVATAIVQQLKQLSLGIVINQARTTQDLSVGTWLMVRAQEDFGFSTRYMGCIAFESAAWLAVRMRRPVLEAFPQSKFVQTIGSIARHVSTARKSRSDDDLLAFATQIAHVAASPAIPVVG